MDKIKARFAGEIEQASNVLDKHERANAVAALKQEVAGGLAAGRGR